MRACIVILAAVATCWPAAASALTVRDVVELTRAGLGEETLLALIEVDPSVFPIDAASLKALKAAGVTERVIIAMIRSGRAPASDQAAPQVSSDDFRLSNAPGPTVVVIERQIDHPAPAPQVRDVQVPVPIYIPVVRHHRDDHVGGSERDDPRRPKEKAAEPVYWGFGGKLRPDAWQPK